MGSIMNMLSNKTADFISRPKQLLIDGVWMPAASSKTFVVTNPATAEVIAEVAEGDAEDINRAVNAARKALESKAWA
ncbi:partial Phenylacetaldehyde dehydrogenase, partial [Methylococcales bacterium]